MSRGRIDEAEKILIKNNGHVAGYNAKENIVNFQLFLSIDEGFRTDATRTLW